MQPIVKFCTFFAFFCSKSCIYQYFFVPLRAESKIVRMETAKKHNTSKRMTVNQRREWLKTIVPGNKYMRAAMENQGSFIVYDPAFML